MRDYFDEEMARLREDVQVFSQKDHANVVALGALALVRVLVPVFQLQEALRVLSAESS